MIRRTSAYFRALMAAAPVMVVPFGRGAAKLVPAEQVDSIKTGIITLSPFAIFWMECEFVLERLQLRAECRRLMKEVA